MTTTETTGRWVALDPDWRGFMVAPGTTTRPVPAVVVLMEAFGVNESVRDLCATLAARGYLALAPDLYQGQVYPLSARERAFAALRALTDDTAMAAVGSALAWLGRAPQVMPGRMAMFGVCMGGRLAFLANSAHAGSLRGAVCFYGGGIAPEQDPFGRPALLDRAACVQGPLWLAYGAEDPSITPAEHGRIAEALSRARRRYTLTVFPGVGHAFLNAYRPGFVPGVAARAWEEALGFLAEILQDA